MGSMSTTRASLADLTLSADASINQGLIEYEAWLENAVSILRELVDMDPQSQTQNDLIEEIMLAIEEVRAAKREERSRQFVATHTHNPLPPFVISSQCAVVDGGQSLRPSDRRGAEPLQGNSSTGGSYHRIPLSYVVT